MKLLARAKQKFLQGQRCRRRLIFSIAAAGPLKPQQVPMISASKFNAVDYTLKARYLPATATKEDIVPFKINLESADIKIEKGSCKRNVLPFEQLTT